MTQLELPPISFARYLDLLKRRRWHVIPISALGLLVGAAFAFFVPRFYVATTVVTFNGSILGTQPGSDDPMEELVDNAELKIPQLTADVLKALGWKEAYVGGWDERRTYEQDVRQRIRVYDVGPTRRGRTTANVRITYKDTDRERAEAFLTALRDLWIEQNQKGLVARADREDKDLAERMQKVTVTLETAEEALRTYERANNINPVDMVAGDNKQRSALTERLTAEHKELDEVEGELDGKRQLLEKKRQLIAPLKPMRVRESSGPVLDEPYRVEVARLQVRIVHLQKALQGVTPAHQGYPMFRKFLEDAQNDLQTFVEAAARARGTRVETTEPDPAYLALRGEIDGLEADIDVLEARRTRLLAQIKDDEALFAKMPDLHDGYVRLSDRVNEARKDRTALEEEGRRLDAKRHQLDFPRAYQKDNERVWVPPRPTDPNIALLALAGSAVGLAVAIGLILLLDVLQTNFKTLADVEHGLSVPVLGGLSHMVTREDQARVTRRRTRVGLAASVFLLLALSVVTIYYVAPTRLPTMVRDVLGVLLGSPP